MTSRRPAAFRRIDWEKVWFYEILLETKLPSRMTDLTTNRSCAVGTANSVHSCRVPGAPRGPRFNLPLGPRKAGRR